MKYTLYCVPGVYGNTRTHYIYIGGWIHPPFMLVLTHGNMTDAEYKRIREDGFISLYSIDSQNWIGIYPRQGRARWLESRKESAVGILRQTHDENIYVGRVRLFSN